MISFDGFSMCLVLLFYIISIMDYPIRTKSLVIIAMPLAMRSDTYGKILLIKTDFKNYTPIKLQIGV